MEYQQLQFSFSQICIRIFSSPNINTLAIYYCSKYVQTCTKYCCFYMNQIVKTQNASVSEKNCPSTKPSFLDRKILRHSTLQNPKNMNAPLLRLLGRLMKNFWQLHLIPPQNRTFCKFSDTQANKGISCGSINTTTTTRYKKRLSNGINQRNTRIRR